MKNPIKIRIDIEQDYQYAKAGLGVRYKVIKWVFERKSGRTLQHADYGTGYTLKEAREAKKHIMNDYLG